MMAKREKKAQSKGLRLVLAVGLFVFSSGFTESLAQIQSPAEAAVICREDVWSRPGVPAYLGVFFGVKDGVLCAGGGFVILPFIVDRLMGLMEGSDIHTLVVDTEGGHVGSAVRFAWEIDRRKLRLVVSGLCVSACANYWIPSAVEVAVVPGGVIAWHGGPSHQLDPITGAMYSETLASDVLLAAMGFSWRYLHSPPKDVENNQKFREMYVNGYSPFWTATPSYMRKQYGFNNLGDFWYPESQHELDNKLPKELKGRVFLSKISE